MDTRTSVHYMQKYQRLGLDVKPAISKCFEAGGEDFRGEFPSRSTKRKAISQQSGEDIKRMFVEGKGSSNVVFNNCVFN